MRTFLAFLTGIALVITWQHTWRRILGHLLSRGDT